MKSLPSVYSNFRFHYELRLDVQTDCQLKLISSTRMDRCAYPVRAPIPYRACVLIPYSIIIDLTVSLRSCFDPTKNSKNFRSACEINFIYIVLEVRA